MQKYYNVYQRHNGTQKIGNPHNSRLDCAAEAAFRTKSGRLTLVYRIRAEATLEQLVPVSFNDLLVHLAWK